jgi:hypothetical protein
MIAVRKVSANRTATWLLPTIIACGFVAGSAIKNLPDAAGDTVVLVHGAHTIAYCLGHGIDSYCDQVSARTLGEINGVRVSAVGPFALFQYLPALLLTQLGLSDRAVYSGLTLTSLVSFFAVIGLGAWTVARTGRRWAPPLFALILVTSPLMYYAGSTLGESLAAFLICLLAVASLRRWPPAVIALCAFLACITKDTAFPIVALLGGAALWATPVASRRLRPEHWYGLGFGIALGLAATAAFNWFRYHQVTNYSYLYSSEQVPGIGRRLGISVALWVAPNGGLAIFWPLAALTVIVASWAVGSQLRGRTHLLSQVLPGMAIIVSIVLVTAINASWWAPFGWISWGPRLMLPTIPATLIIVIALYGKQFESLLRSLLGTTLRAGLFAVGVIAIGLPQSNILNARDAVAQLFTPDAICPVAPHVEVAPERYYMCLNHWAWARHWTFLDTMQAFSHTSGVIFAVTFVLAWVALLVVTRTAFTAPQSV